MSDRSHGFLILSGIVTCAILSAACVSTAIGDVAYTGNGLSFSVLREGGPSEGYVQITIYQIRDNQQRETNVLYEQVTLHPGRNSVFIPVSLEPGQYKLAIHLIQNGEREAATIRDIVVN